MILYFGFSRFSSGIFIILLGKKYQPMQFPQISVLSFLFYVDIIKKLEKVRFYH